MKSAKAIRKEIGELDFEFWVRLFRPADAAWVSAVYGNEKRSKILCARLRELGYEPIMDGKRGTSGEYIIKIQLK